MSSVSDGKPFFPSATPLEELPKATPPPIRELNENEKRNLLRKRETTLRELRVFLRDATNKLMAERRFKEFTKPVDPEEVKTLTLCACVYTHTSTYIPSDTCFLVYQLLLTVFLMFTLFADYLLV